jgi:hypothetical protein
MTISGSELPPVKYWHSRQWQKSFISGAPPASYSSFPQ